MAGPWDQLFVVAELNERQKQQKAAKVPPAKPCRIEGCDNPRARVSTTGDYSSYCAEHRREINRTYRKVKKCDSKISSENTSGS